MFPYIVRFLHGGGADSPQVLATFLTASLFAAHPSHAPIGNLGASLRRAVAGKHGREGVTARFTAVLDADPEDLPRRLVELVRLCESAGAPLDWTRFYWDVYRLIGQDQDARDKTRLAWAKGFWSQPQEENQTPKLQEKQP
jgi:CRISPR type I-E-associated protein CasB/Cse2